MCSPSPKSDSFSSNLRCSTERQSQTECRLCGSISQRQLFGKSSARKEGGGVLRQACPIPAHLGVGLAERSGSDSHPAALHILKERGKCRARDWNPSLPMLAHLAAWTLFVGRMQQELVPAGPESPSLAQMPRLLEASRTNGGCAHLLGLWDSGKSFGRMGG